MVMRILLVVTSIVAAVLFTATMVMDAEYDKVQEYVPRTEPEYEETVMVLDWPERTPFQNEVKPLSEDVAPPPLTPRERLHNFGLSFKLFKKLGLLDLPDIALVELSRLSEDCEREIEELDTYDMHSLDERVWRTQMSYAKAKDLVVAPYITGPPPFYAKLTK